MRSTQPTLRRSRKWSRPQLLAMDTHSHNWPSYLTKHVAKSTTFVFAPAGPIAISLKKPHCATWVLLAALLVTAVVYCPGLSGSWLFDDYPNIVDNPGVQPHEVSVPALVRAALSSPASDF